MCEQDFDLDICLQGGGFPGDRIGCPASPGCLGVECDLRAWCLSDDTCAIMAECWCPNWMGGIFNGPNTTCEDVDDRLCRSDFDDDGIVRINDFLFLLASSGVRTAGEARALRRQIIDKYNGEPEINVRIQA